jgi:hypothetical protein
VDDPDKALGRLKIAVAALQDQFDTVQIFATKHDAAPGKGTYRFEWGAGSWYARYGHVRGWMLRQDEGLRVEEQRAAKEDDGG